MNHASLFSGIGGFDLAATWVGWKNIFNIEIDAFCRRVLKFHFQEALQFNDIRKFDGRIFYGTVDVISGGFPCQPFSLAGQRLGSSDDRYLWPEMLRIINEIRPTWVIGENVAGILSMVQPGLQINLGGQAGFKEEDQEVITEHEYVLHTIIQDFERIGYSVQPFVIPACGVGAPHRRNRVWLIAYSGGSIQWAKFSERTKDNSFQKWPEVSPGFASVGSSGIITNAHSQGLEGATSAIISPGTSRQYSGFSSLPTWRNWPTQSPVCRRNDGLPPPLVNITFSKWRRESLQAFGNAIVPQVAYQIFSTIERTRNVLPN